MKLMMAVCADHASGGDKGKLTVVGVFDTLFAMDFPVTYASMSLVLRFLAEREDEERKHPLRVRLLKPDGGDVFKVEGEVGIGTLEAGQFVHVNHILNMQQVTFEGSGLHAFHVYLDGEEIARVPLQVKKKG